jgi:hypothetical protein
MATMTMEPATLKTAMGKIGLYDKADDLLDVLDKMEMDRELQLSLEEADRGEYEDVFEALEDIRKEIHER